MSDTYDITKQAVLLHIADLFQEIEQDLALSHQEKYALLEDAFENATDADELRVAFEQWYMDHADDLELDTSVAELWDAAVSGMDEEEDDDF